MKSIKRYFGWTVFHYYPEHNIVDPVQTFWTYSGAEVNRFDRVVSNLDTPHETDKYYIAKYRWGLAYNSEASQQRITTQEKK